MICVLTYRRPHAIAAMLEGLRKHCGAYPINIFDDCSATDGTRDLLTGPGHLTGGPGPFIPELAATRCRTALGEANIKVYVGEENLGVAGNSNRALKVFMESDCDHLLLCNDDLLVLGDFAGFYAQAHLDLGAGFFAFTDFWESPTHRWVIARSRGYRVKLFPRMTGIMMSVLRRTVDKVGYFDPTFGKFGEEHCDWTNRIRMAGEIKLDGFDQACIDVEPTAPDGSAAPPVLKPQIVTSSVVGAERIRADQVAARAIANAATRYATESPYRPFLLRCTTHLGGVGTTGTKLALAGGYQRS